MLVKKEKLAHFLEVKNLSKEKFAAILDVEVSEVEKMLNGEIVGLHTSRRFIRFFKAEVAQHYIDWETMNIKNPLEEKRNEKF